MTPLIPLLVSAGIVPGVAEPPVCHPIDSDSVLARDVAPLVPGFAKLPGDFLIGYVGSSGAPKIFRAADLENIAKNRGIELPGLEDLCLQRRTFVVPAASIADAMRKALGGAAVDIQILSSSQQPVPSGEVVFPRSGVQPPFGPEVTWRGYVQAGKGATYPMAARARITLETTRVIAVTDLPFGKPIQKNQLRVEAAQDSPFEESFLLSADDAVDLVPKTAIPKGSTIRKSQVAPQMDVARGDMVRVEVRLGNAHLSMDARAETSGMRGTTVTVRNLSSGRDFQAQVEGRDRVTVGGLNE
jgi:flagella basal body P-ring formation protein FlgA